MLRKLVAQDIEPDPTSGGRRIKQEVAKDRIIDIDRGYLASEAIAELFDQGVTIHSKPWVPTNKGLFTKLDFRIDARRRTVTCPNSACGRPWEGHICRRGLLALQEVSRRRAT